MGGAAPKGGSVVDASYLALVSDQYLRTTVIAGRTDLGMPDWREYVKGQPMTAGGDRRRRRVARVGTPTGAGSARGRSVAMSGPTSSHIREGDGYVS